MLGVYLTGHGGLDKLVIRENAPVPVPEAGEVLVKVGACAINNSDLWTREGAYGTGTDSGRKSGWRREPMKFPRIQGMDIAGRIMAVGENVSDSRIGERVLVDYIIYSDAPDGLEGCELIGSERDGGYAEKRIGTCFLEARIKGKDKDKNVNGMEASGTLFHCCFV